MLALNDEQTAYGVLVTTDSMEFVLIRATVDKIDPSVLGRWATVKAKVTQRTDAKNATIQILEVTVAKAEAKTPR